MKPDRVTLNVYVMSHFKKFAVQKLLPLFNFILKLISLKLVTLRTPNRDFPAFFNHLRGVGIEFKTVIDVGVGHGSPTIYKSIPQAKFYLVEPVPSAKPLLEKLSRELNAKVFNVAAGATDGSIEFFVHPDTTGSSSYKQLEGTFFDGTSVMVPVRRLDQIIDQPLARPALLKIDTQGAELEVLAGAEGILDQLDVIIVEVSFHEFRQGAPEVHDIVIRMAELGFRCYEVLEGHYRSVDNALAQVDFAFVKKESDLRAVKSFFSKEQAIKYLQRGDV